MEVTKQLFSMRDEEYAAFQSKLTPNIDMESFIGVRVPILRKYAKEYKNNTECKEFLLTLPHQYYDENMLHGILLSEIKDYEDCIEKVEKFLPYVDNWAVCDIMSPKVFKKHKVQLIDKIKEWSGSKHTYTCRFGLEMLMSFYLDEDFKDEYLEIPVKVQSKEYYVNMMIAWFMATALAKQWEATIPYITENRLGDWVHNKTIQKACESYRITKEQKAYLKSYKRKR